MIGVPNITIFVHKANRLTPFCRRLTSHGFPHKKQNVRRRQNRLTLFFGCFFWSWGDENRETETISQTLYCSAVRMSDT